ncbi:type II secretion system protein [Niallia sp. XMNu-256]|uniref:PilW family protein n=1 Tax=Niallia sp. XMNu-256 TaxID=3082444 RepID=UPI0030CB3623
MKNQSGVTLIELLIVIFLMGIIFIPISNLVILSLKSEKDVSIKNEAQREARLVMEVITEEMRDSNVEWVPYDSLDSANNSKKLVDQSNLNDPIDLLHYNNNGDKGIIVKDGVILSTNIKEFTVIEDLENDLINIKLIIQKSDFEFELQSDIIHPDIYRF